MNITEIIKSQGIVINSKVQSKSEALNVLINLHQKCDNLKNKDKYKEEILKREKTGSTSVGNQIAIPHAKSNAVKRVSLTAMTVKDGIVYSENDAQKTRLIFMIAAPENGDAHLEVLSKLMKLLLDENFTNSLLDCKNAEEFLSVIDKKEREKFSSTVNDSAENYDVLAVTACPTGIAHTFMAAEALQKAAQEKNIKIKVETNGSDGVKNALTSDDIKNAKGIIVAADRDVETARFDGKPVLKVPVAKGIKASNELIDEILSDKVSVYHHKGGEVKSDSTVSESGTRRLYKHLMNGVSHMLPFVIGGGILIALAFLIDTLSGAPQNSSFGSNTALAAIFKSIGSIAFNFMMPVLSGYIAMSIADRPGLAVGFVGGYIATVGCTFASPGGDSSAVSGFLGALLAGFIGGYIVVLLKKIFSFLPKSMEGIKPVLIYPLFGILLMGLFMFIINPYVGILNTALSNGLESMGTTSKILLGALLGGMMAIDMGGPFNKAAYVFGTASLATGGYDIMAAVMIGGMVPPIAIALCATFFKNKFSPDDRKSAMVNYVLGLCFITEGAIPFAAADPFRVIPSCIAGSAAAGALSMAFGCTLMAPHGGIFVFPVVTRPLFYLLALLAGSVISMLILGFIRKKEVTPIEN